VYSKLYIALSKLVVRKPHTQENKTILVFYLAVLLMPENFDDFWGEPMHSYTRKEAIEDGYLIDLMQGEWGELVKQAGFRFPTAMSSAAFGQYVEVTPAAKKAGQDIKGRLWDVLWMLKMAITRSKPNQSQLLFQFYCTVDKPEAELCTLKCVVAPDDDGQPCFTILLPEED
jgi:hypothetical protein